MADARFASLQGQKYINLESFRKNGQGVRTPVWFAGDPQEGAPEKLYVYSTANAGKTKRIRNNGRVCVAACDMRGKLLGEWMEGRAGIVNSQEAKHATHLLNKKYFPWKQILAFFALFSSQKRVVFVIRPA
jgi:uncharacterized protein